MSYPQVIHRFSTAYPQALRVAFGIAIAACLVACSDLKSLRSGSLSASFTTTPSLEERKSSSALQAERAKLLLPSVESSGGSVSSSPVP